MSAPGETHPERLLDEGRVEVVVEIPRGSRNKYEQDEDGIIWFDRRLGGPAGFPGDYGYVVGAYGEDGDAMDALVLLDEPTVPGVHIVCRVVGGYVLEVDGSPETKLICVPVGDHHQAHLQDLEDMPESFRRELDAFFQAYRMLESADVRVRDHCGRAEALDAVRRGRRR